MLSRFGKSDLDNFTEVTLLSSSFDFFKNEKVEEAAPAEVKPEPKVEVKVEVKEEEVTPPPVVEKPVVEEKPALRKHSVQKDSLAVAVDSLR